MERVKRYRDFTTGEWVEVPLPAADEPTRAQPAKREQKGSPPPPGYFEEIKEMLTKRKDPWNHVENK